MDAPASPHAIPLIYPPSPRHKHIPENSLLQSHLLPWRRRPSVVCSPSLAATSVLDLIEMFSKLNIRDDQRRPMHSIHIPEIGAAVASITVKPFSAPLFAFCGPVSFVTKAALDPLPTVPAPRTPLHPFRAPSPGAQPVTLIPSNIRKASKTGRKVAPLPRRIPQVSIKSKQNLMRSIPDYSSYRSLSSGSSARSSSPELSLSVATTPEVGSPFPLSLSDESPPVQESHLPTDHGVFGGLAADRLSGELWLNPSSASNPTPHTIPEISVSQATSSTIMRAMRKAAPPSHARLPLCVGS